MIGKISGILEWRGADHVLIDVRGVGYLVYLSERNLRSLPALGEAVAFYTDLVVREDLLQLFGFETLFEKEWHRLLTSVQGVGSKVGLAILGSLGVEGVARAITLGDARAIQAAPGVGPKLAQRIALELKSKAPNVMSAGVILDHSADVKTAKPKPANEAPSDAQSASDALSALSNLGYGHGDAAEAIARTQRDAANLDTSALIRAALRLLAPKE